MTDEFSEKLKKMTLKRRCYELLEYANKREMESMAHEAMVARLTGQTISIAEENAQLSAENAKLRCLNDSLNAERNKWRSNRRAKKAGGK